MEFSIKSTVPGKHRSACIVVGVFESKQLSASAASLDKLSGGLLTSMVKRGDIEGKSGQTLMLHSAPKTLAERILLVGLGKQEEFGDIPYRKALSKAVATLKETAVPEAIFYLTDLDVKDRDSYWKVRQAVEIIRGSVYQFNQLKSKKENNKAIALKKVTLDVANKRDISAGERAVREGQAIADGMDLAKNMGNLPANICTPSYLAKQAKALEKVGKKIKVTVLDEAAMERVGMGALLAVARGTHEPAKLITIEYAGAKKGDKPVVLVGKGVTFDTGGISIKPAQAMDEMKYDMSGAASVIGTLRACAQLQLPINVVGVIPTTENMPGGSAIKPGDIITSLSGQTIEILNTDAEGRLILCDALTYSERFKPAVVIDIATLTGACVIALGKHPSGLLSNDQPLAQDLLQAGDFSGDRVWQLPLWEEYQDQLKTNFADMANVGGREGGTITAACFLWRFTKQYRWAHLDIAGTAWLGGDQKGSTGRPVPLLTQYLINQCDKGREKTLEKRGKKTSHA